jgi:hypothetical protein
MKWLGLVLVFSFGAGDTGPEDLDNFDDQDIPESYVVEILDEIPASTEVITISDLRRRLREERSELLDEQETDEAAIERRRQNRLLARKLLFAISFFFFTNLILPILVDSGYFRIA